MNERQVRIYELKKNEQERESILKEAKVEMTLDWLGIQRRKEGFNLLKEIILYVLKKPEGLKAFKKQVFPEIFPGKTAKEIYDKCSEAMSDMSKASNVFGKNLYAEITGEELSAKNFPTVKEFVENMYNYLCE